MFKFNFVKTLFLDLFYPRICECCESLLFSGEKLICTKCIYNIPITNYHLLRNNKLNRIFWSRVSIENACSFFYYNKASVYQTLIHAFKYRGRLDIGLRLSNLFGLELKKTLWISDIDIIIPVPLHSGKLQKRGYNQALIIARGISEITEIPVCDDVLFRKTNSSTQTNKTRLERWENVDDIFSVRYVDSLVGKHILLVDDVITTGSTLESCAQIIKSTNNSIVVSIATLASS